ncbi:hypothetical protein M434DRAFT_17877 [Hypoxylon sp. CO27-5]|nr:hypothetical protein M434DRAFT_17877 [Hypoxylon sp. CO27-5]
MAAFMTLSAFAPRWWQSDKQSGGSITLCGGKITSIRTATSIVLGTAAKLTPRAGERITLPSKITVDGAGSVHNLPVGTMVFFDPTMPERWRQYTHDETLPREFTIPPTNILILSRDVMIPLNTSVLLSENTFFPGGITLPGGVILSSNIAIQSSDQSFCAGTTLPDNFYVPQKESLMQGDAEKNLCINFKYPMKPRFFRRSNGTTEYLHVHRLNYGYQIDPSGVSELRQTAVLHDLLEDFAATLLRSSVVASGMRSRTEAIQTTEFCRGGGPQNDLSLPRGIRPSEISRTYPHKQPKIRELVTSLTGIRHGADLRSV